MRSIVAFGPATETVCHEAARARRVGLTAEGRRMARDLDRRSRQRFQDVLDLLSARERANIPAALDRLAEAMEILSQRVGGK